VDSHFYLKLILAFAGPSLPASILY